MALFSGLETGSGRVYLEDRDHSVPFASALSFSNLAVLVQKSWHRLIAAAASGRTR